MTKKDKAILALETMIINKVQDSELERIIRQLKEFHPKE